MKLAFDLKTCRSKLQDHAQDEKLKALKNRSEEMGKACERCVSFMQQARYRLEQSLRTIMDELGKPLPHPFTKICERRDSPTLVKNTFCPTK